MLELAKAAAIEAGKFLEESLGTILLIERKEGQETNLVTQIDKQSKELIISMIRKKYPDHTFLAEESGSDDVKSDYRWVIDPLDGTINFTHGLKIFCKSIALEYKGEIILGAVYDPSLNELFWTEKGKGAYLNNERMRVSSTSKLIESLLVTGFPYNVRTNPENPVGHFVNFLYEGQAIRRLGSAALDLCYVAAGRFEGFWEVTLNPWDMAAGWLCVEEAGGKVTDLLGHPTTIYKRNILATNGLVHDAMVEVLKRGMK